MFGACKLARQSSRGVRAALAFTMVVVGFALTTPFASAAPAARTLVSPTPIRAFAQDGRFVAWVDKQDRRRSAAAACSSATWPRAGNAHSSGNMICVSARMRSRLRVAAWSGRPSHSPAAFASVPVCSRHPSVTRVSRWFGQFPNSAYQSGGRTLTAFSGGTRHNAISWVDYRLVEESCDVEVDPTIPCLWDVTGGRVDRVVGHTRQRVPGTGPVVELATAAGLLASVPAADQWEGAQEGLGPLPVED